MLPTVEHDLGTRPRDVGDTDVLAGHHQIRDVAGIEASERDLIGRRPDVMPVPEPEVVLLMSRVVEAEGTAVDGHRIREFAGGQDVSSRPFYQFVVESGRRYGLKCGENPLKSHPFFQISVK